MADNELQIIIDAHHARLNITYAGQNGELRDPVPFDSGDGDIKAWAQEAVRNGDIAALGRHADATFHDFVVDRYGPTEERPHNLIMLRPKTAFGTFDRGGDILTDNGNGKRLPFKEPELLNPFDAIKVFSSTKMIERNALGETITAWMDANKGIKIVDKVITQSSDNEYHCYTITLFYLRAKRS